MAEKNRERFTLDDLQMKLEFEDKPLRDFGDTGEYVTSFHARVTLSSDTDSEEDDRLLEMRGDFDPEKDAAATANGFVIHACRGCNDRVDVLDECDAVSQEAHEFSALLLDVDGSIRDDLSDLIEPAVADVFVFETVEVHPALRGHDIGLRLVRRLLDMLGADSHVAALKAHPMLAKGERTSRDDSPEVATAKAARISAASAKLAAYWARLGFMECPLPKDWLGEGGFMLLDLTVKSPSLRDLDKPKPKTPIRKRSARGGRAPKKRVA